MALLADIKGVDLSFLKDDGWRKYSAFMLGMVGIILWVCLGFMPVGEGVGWLLTLIGALTGLNLVNKAMVWTAAKNQAKPDAPPVDPEVQKALETLKAKGYTQ
jgi:hypothetical protein